MRKPLDNECRGEIALKKGKRAGAIEEGYDRNYIGTQGYKSTMRIHNGYNSDLSSRLILQWEH